MGNTWNIKLYIRFQLRCHPTFLKILPHSVLMVLAISFTLIGNNKDQKYVSTQQQHYRQAGGFDDPIPLFPVFVSYLIIMFSLQDLDDDQLVVVNQSRP